MLYKTYHDHNSLSWWVDDVNTSNCLPKFLIYFPWRNRIIVDVKTLNRDKPWQNGGHFPDDICKCIFFKGNIQILVKISLKFVHGGPINNIPALFQIKAWHRPGDKPLYEPVMVSLLHLCVTQPQWDNRLGYVQRLLLRSEINDLVLFMYRYCVIFQCQCKRQEQHFPKISEPLISRTVKLDIKNSASQS